MEKYQSDDTFLARWAAGELTPEELAEFEKSEAFKAFDKINKESQQFNAPPIDKAKSLIEVNEKITFGAKRKLISRLAIAASVSIMIVSSVLVFSTKSYTTDSGEQMAVTLPDGSTVQLAAKSRLRHKRFFWLNNRKVKLEGEAFFDVQKGDGFRVQTIHGTTSVLGTRFNVRSRPKRFSVDCFEGKVKVETAKTDQEFVLTPGNGVKLSDGEYKESKVSGILPAWMTGLSVFANEKLSAVIEELKVQYGINFETGNQNLELLFSGSFVHKDLDKALRSTLMPMGVDYELDVEAWTVIFKE